MDNTILCRNLSDILVEYFTLKSIESHDLFRHSQGLLRHQPVRKIRCKAPEPASDIVTLPTTKSHPSLRTTNYHPTNFYKFKNDNEILTFIPLSKDSKEVLPDKLLGVYERTPFKALESDPNLVQGKQFAVFLGFKIHSIPGVSNLTQVTTIYRQIFGISKKNTKLIANILNIPRRIAYLTARDPDEASEFYDKMCRNCKTYTCFMHFIDKKPELLTDISRQKFEVHRVSHEHKMDDLDPNNVKNRWWQNRANAKESGRWLLDYKCKYPERCGRRVQKNSDVKIKPRSKFILKKMLSKGVRNPCSISLFIGYSCEDTAYFIQSYISYYEELPTPHKLVRFPPTDLVSHQPILSSARENCSCTKVCTEETACECYSSTERGVCHKFCECNIKCNRFLGCNCQMGQCKTDKCLCFANQRECDPDICLSCCALQAIRMKRNGALFTTGKGKFLLCKNVKIQQGLRKRTGLSISTLPGAGLGLFALEDVKRDEFITEYTGELLSSQESERKGAIYDAQEHSYIFGIGNFAIDATYLGNKMRFVNHKSHNEQNCEAVTWAINGNSIVILKAKKLIKKGDELFFDYGYNKETISYTWYREYEDSFDKKNKVKKSKYS
jgi:hypothetical protein